MFFQTYIYWISVMHPWNFIFFVFHVVVKPVFFFGGGLRSTCLFGDLPYGCSCDLGLTSFCSSLWFWGFLGVWIWGFGSQESKVVSIHPFGNLYQQAIWKGFGIHSWRREDCLGCAISWGVVTFLEGRKVQIFEKSSCCWRNILD